MTPAKLLALAAVLQLCRACPAPCSCRWRQGKQAAACVGAGLGAVPAGLDAGTQVLDLSDNGFRELPNRVFRDHGLINLQKIFLRDCGVASVAEDAFFQLSNLVELDLSYNQLPAVPSSALRGCPNLRRLQLSHNPITLVKGGAFSHLLHLSYLSLGNCQIQHIAQGAFDGLNSLEVIELDGNQLATLPIQLFQPLTGLTGLHLYNNPWNCDCKIREIRTWMIEKNIPLSISPVCKSPPFVRNTPWKNLTLEDFACFPQMIQVETEYNAISGQNVSISCSVHAVPKASIHWEIDAGQLSTELRTKYHVLNSEGSSRQTSVLTIYNVSKDESNTFYCVAENKAGSSVMNFSLTVLHPSKPWSNNHVALIFIYSSLSLLVLAALAICYCFFFTEMWSKLLSKEPVLSHMKPVERKAPDIPESVSEQLTPDLVCNFADAPPSTGAADRAKLQVERNGSSDAYLNQCYALQSAGLNQLREERSCASPQDGHFRRYSMLVVDASASFPPKSSFSPDEGYDEEGLEVTQM